MNTLRFICAVILGSASVVMGQVTAITPAVGYEKLEARGLSDTYFGIPLAKRSILTGRVDHVTAHAITISPSTRLEQVVTPADGKNYYLQFVTGNLAGLCLRIRYASDPQVGTGFAFIGRPVHGGGRGADVPDLSPTFAGVLRSQRRLEIEWGSFDGRR